MKHFYLKIKWFMCLIEGPVYKCIFYLFNLSDAFFNPLFDTHMEVIQNNRVKTK